MEIGCDKKSKLNTNTLLVVTILEDSDIFAENKCIAKVPRVRVQMTFFWGVTNEKHVPSFVDFLYIIKLAPPTKHAIVGPHVKLE